LGRGKLKQVEVWRIDRSLKKVYGNFILIKFQLDDKLQMKLKARALRRLKMSQNFQSRNSFHRNLAFRVFSFM
jgi:hypothetical protein